METILINWLKDYSIISDITIETKFIDLNFDLFDQAMTVDFIKETFNKNINQREKWYITVGELINDIS